MADLRSILHEEFAVSFTGISIVVGIEIQKKSRDSSDHQT
jgi:hypothetical protein